MQNKNEAIEKDAGANSEPAPSTKSEPTSSNVLDVLNQWVLLALG